MQYARERAGAVRAMTTGGTRGRILTVLSYYHPYMSGLSEYARLVAEGAASRGFSVTVLTGRHAADLPESEVINGVSVVRALPLVFIHKGYLSLQLFTRFLREMRTADVAHFHLPMLESGLLAVIGRRSVPILATYQCDVVPSGSGGLIDAMAIQAVRRSCRICVNRARIISVTSADYAAGSEVLRGTAGKWVEIPPPDKGARTPPVTSTSRETMRVGFLGRFVEEKGIDVLLDAAPLVLHRLPGVQFILAGDFTSVAGGSEYERLRGRIAALGGSVQVPGHIPEERLQEFYASLDVFVLPSISSYEAFGMVQVEAMKAGVPVVATDMRGVRIPVRTTGNGVLVPPRQAPALADAIVQVLTEPRFRARREIFDRAWAAFSPDRSVDRYVELYSSLIEGRTT
jgi:glycosyltransferase involved in cell wall biosynthesis